MWTKAFWKNTAERMIKTYAQTAAALLTGEGLGLADINWTSILSIAAVATIYSALTSIGSAPVGESGTPSLTRQ